MTLQSFYAFYIKCLQTKVQEELKRFLNNSSYSDLLKRCSKKLHENKYLKLTFNNQKSNLGILYPFTNNKSLYKDTSYRKNLTIYSQKYYLTCCIKFEFFLQPKQNPSQDDDGIRTINDVASSQNVCGTKDHVTGTFSNNSN